MLEVWAPQSYLFEAKAINLECDSCLPLMVGIACFSCMSKLMC